MNALQRQQKLEFLLAMDVELSSQTRLSDAELEKRLSKAIDAAQSLPNTVYQHPVEPISLPPWQAAPDRLSLPDAVKRLSPTEKDAPQRAESLGRENNSASFNDSPFIGWRRLLQRLGKAVSEGQTKLMVDDSHENLVLACQGRRYPNVEYLRAASSICIRIVEVREIKPNVPMFILYYRRTCYAGIDSGIDWFTDASFRGPVSTLTLRPQVLNFLYTVLDLNARRISPGYTPARERSEQQSTLSFLLPTGPINQLELGHLSLHPGCTVCGGKVMSKCAQCRSVAYCGAECQKINWKEHKTMCLSLKGRTWTPITVTTKLDNSDVGTSPESDESKTLDGASEILPNIDGDRPFLVVIRPVQEPNSPMLITDQWGSFTVYLQESQDPTSHAEVMNVMQGRHEVYRWAKRSSNLQFSVCLDGAPVTDPVW